MVFQKFKLIGEFFFSGIAGKIIGIGGGVVGNFQEMKQVLSVFKKADFRKVMFPVF